MDANFFSGNRSKFIESIKGGVAVITAYTKMQRSGDASAPFEQESNFWWLTGIAMPDWRLIVEGATHKSWLVAPDIEANHKLFDGSLDPGVAQATSAVDGVLSADEALALLRSLAKKHPLVYTLADPPYASYVDFILNPASKKNRENLERIFSTVQDCRKELSQMRAIKQPAEVDAIGKAMDLTVGAFRHAKDSLGAGMYEYEIEAELAYEFRKKGATHAFDPIVASGGNACTLHYVDNSSRIVPNEFVLIDAGARLAGYPADVTRTFSVGNPTERQAAVHNAVQDAQRQIIGLLEPELGLEEYIRNVDDVMKRALLSLGLIEDENDDSGYRRYFPHAISHGLGVDVHDSLGGRKYFQPNMILTVEPGIYIPEERIGVRIEDSIIITENGHRNLSDSLSTDM